MNRTVTAEALDTLAPDHPAARRSRRDLVRVHQAMGTQGIVMRGWHALVPPQRAAAPLRILELGAGDGSLLLGVARALAPGWAQVQLSLLDRQDIVSATTLAGFARAGWAPQVQVANVLAWAARPEEAVPGTEPPRWDLITTALFLHHFDGDELDQLLAAVAARCDRFFAFEPSRTWLALAGGHAVGAIGANAVTRGDAVLSVQAGFRRHEISALWPRGSGQWQLREYSAGLFGHCFSAQRIGAAA